MAFNLQSLQRGKNALPPRIIIYGAHGLGKSTFGAGAPSPVFIQTEDGLGAIDTTKFDLAKSYENVLEAISSLYTEEHDFKTVVLDSLDWLERLIWKTVTDRHAEKNAKIKNIDDIGYGKGFKEAADLMQNVLRGLNALREEKGMCVICTAHVQTERFDDPTDDPYHRFRMKMHKTSSAICSEWADVVAFATQEKFVKKNDVGFNKEVSRAMAGNRVMKLSPNPAYDAKNRFNLPAEIPLSWKAFSEAYSNAMSSST